MPAMNLYPWLELGHVLASMIWLGGGLLLFASGVRVRTASDPAALTDFARSLGWFGPRVLAPAVVAVLVFGVAMVLDSAAWDFGQTWLLIAIGLFLVAFAVGAVYLSRLALQLERRSETDPIAGRALLDRWLAAYGLVLLTLVLTAWDMLFKPGIG
jgi:uncharacterized membrane protein